MTTACFEVPLAPFAIAAGSGDLAVRVPSTSISLVPDLGRGWLHESHMHIDLPCSSLLDALLISMFDYP